MKKQITMQELKSIIKEEVQKIQRRTILESKKKKLIKELRTLNKELSEVSDEGKYTWKDLGDFGHDMVGDFVEYNGEYYKVISNGTIDDENGEPEYSAFLKNVKTGEKIEVSIYDITRINPNDVGIEWWDDDKDSDFDSEVSDIENKYNINDKYENLF